MIIIDNLAENFSAQKDNGIKIKTWEGDQNDVALCDLLLFLKNLAKNEVDDVWVFLRNHREEMGEDIDFENENFY